MDELKKIVFLQLRTGVSITEILNNFQRIEAELITMQDYVKAMAEAHKAP